MHSLDAQYTYLARIRTPSVPMERIHEYVRHHIMSLDECGDGKKLKEEILTYMHDLEKVGSWGVCQW